MAILIVISNYLVQFQINDWVTWSAFTYPLTYLITELINRVHGSTKAKWVVFVGFILAIIFSATLDNARIALAAGIAFLFSQTLDIALFNRLARSQWWLAPAIVSVVIGPTDTMIFFYTAFVGTKVPWVTLGLGEIFIKLIVDLFLLLPFRLYISNKAQSPNSTIENPKEIESLFFQNQTHKPLKITS